MRRGAVIEWVCLGLAALCFVAGFAFLEGGRNLRPPGDPYEDGLRVLTWNVGGALGGEAHPVLDEELDHVARTLLALKPDLAFLQEVRSGRQAKQLLSKLGEDWRLEVSRSRRGRQIIALAHGLVFEEEPDISVRGSLPVALRFEGGARVLAVGVHADAFSSKKRNELLGLVTDELMAVDGIDLRLLVGDFNLDLDLDKRRDLFSDDAYLDVETYNYVSEQLRDAARGSGATAEPDRRLDYVFSSAAPKAIRAAGPIRGQRIGDMDHDPLVVDLEPLGASRE